MKGGRGGDGGLEVTSFESSSVRIRWPFIYCGDAGECLGQPRGSNAIDTKEAFDCGEKKRSRRADRPLERMWGSSQKA